MKTALKAMAMAACLAALCSGCGGGRQRAVQVAGSTSIQPFAQMLASEYEKQQGEVKVQVQGGGSMAGIQAVSNGMAQIGMCSRDLTPEETKLYAPIVIARDGIALIVHPSNPVKGLTKEQVRAIFAGDVKNWKAVGGPDLAVTAVTREDGSGTRETFTHLVMGSRTIAPGVRVQPSNGTVRETVRSSSGTIGYISLGLVNKDVKPLEIDGVAATEQGVIEGKYTLARPFLFILKGSPTPDAKAFIDYVLSDKGQDLLVKKGLIRAK